MTDWPPEWTEAAKAWRAERDKSNPIDWTVEIPPPPKGCEVCGDGPCRFPTFCSLAEASFKHPVFRTGGHLPDRWWEMSENQLGNAIDRAVDKEWRDNRTALQARSQPRPPSDPTRQTRRRIRGKWTNIYDDGVSCGLSSEYPGKREKGGYPLGFHDWDPEQRNAWFAGFNVGYLKRGQP